MGKSGLKKLKNIINYTRSSLKWKVLEHKNSDYNDATIFSDNFAKTHEIFYPKINYGTDVTFLLEMLHELCHATLAEQIHPQFATCAFKPGTLSSEMDVIEIPYKIAADWFTNAHLHKLCPDQFKKDVSQLLSFSLYEISLSHEKNLSKVNPYYTALLLAESIKWLRTEIIIEGIYKPIVDAIMSVDPDKPSLNALELLINRLLAIQTKVQVKAVYSEEYRLELFDIRVRPDNYNFSEGHDH